jgi:hypothetical protein
VSGVADFSYAFSKNRNLAGAPSSNGNPKSTLAVWSGVSKWITTSLTSMAFAFQGANEMNADLSKWSVAKVKTLQRAFHNTFKFAGTGLSVWRTPLLTNLGGTFMESKQMNADVSGFDVSLVTDISETFYATFKFTGTGLSGWDTSSITSMSRTFRYADSMNGDLSGWDVAKGAC